MYTLVAGISLTLSIVHTPDVSGQAPQSMSYQSVLRNSSNALLHNTLVGIKISVLQGSISGTEVYAETQVATTNVNGLLSIQIGNGTANNGTFAGINWGNGPHYIKTEADPTGGTNYTIIGAQEILSVPYALYANNGITTAQADAIVTMQAQILALQDQISGLIPLPTVVIGTQTWTSTNLNVATYRDGTPIPEVQDPEEWAGLTTGAWCHLNNDPANDAIYGKMYNHYAVVDPRGLAPEGYHVPTFAEYDIMIQTIPMGATCQPNTSWYNAPALMDPDFYNGTNTTGFSALKGGLRTGDAIDGPGPDNQPAGHFDTYSTRFWSSDTGSNLNSIFLYNQCAIGDFNTPSNHGSYVRLIKD